MGPWPAPADPPPHNRKIFPLAKHEILLPSARHREERPTVRQSVSQSGKQAGRQAGRHTQFGWFSVADYI